MTVEAVRSTVAGVTVSVTLAVAVPLPTIRLSKLPPETPVMLRRQAGGVAVDVLAVARGNGQRAGGGAVGDADVALVGVDGGHALRGVRQRRREHVVGAGALGDRRGREVDGGRGDGVGDVGRRRAAADDQALEVAAGDAGDAAPSGWRRRCRRPRRCPRQWSACRWWRRRRCVMSPWSVWMVVTPCEAFDSVAVNT